MRCGSRAVAARLALFASFASLFAAGVVTATIQADPPPTTGTTSDTSTSGSVGTTTDTSTTPTATAPATTSTSVPTPTAPAFVPTTRPIVGGCLAVGGLALLRPGRAPVVLGPLAQRPGAAHGTLGPFSYPAGGAVVTASSVTLAVDGCGRPGPASGSAAVRSLSLFGGAVTAQSVDLDAREGSSSPRGAITGLGIDGAPASARPGLRLPIANWGYAVVLGPPAPASQEPGSLASALAVHLTAPHAGLAAGTVLLVSFGLVPAPKAAASARHSRAIRPLPHHGRLHSPARKRTRSKLVHKRHRTRKKVRPGDRPLKVTPPLGLSGYVFPVVGHADYVDTYGAFRGDVAGNGHHGDDIFAALGTPVVAVATGTVNRVGWERIGGWRLWVRDRLGNEFYYAHLSGYAPAVLHSRRVSAGQVIGFIGNTGDAFTTSPHLHFEIHPHTLLRLHYGGAVDPTTYLNHWRHIGRIRAPRPGLPTLPRGAVRQEAKYVFRELLAARHLIKHAPKLSERPRISVPGSLSPSIGRRHLTERKASVEAASHPRRGVSMLTVSLLAALGSLALAALAVSRSAVRRRIARLRSRSG